MKFIKTFENWDKVSPGLKAHVNEDLDLTNSLFRLGSDAYCKLFEEVKQYWDKGNIVLNGPSGWMAKNLEVGTAAVYTPRGGNTKKVKLDSPERGGTKKFIVYRNSGRTDKEGNIVAKKVEWGDPNLSVKNDDPGKAASFWARHQCDQKKKMDPTKAGFWACYGPTLFGKQLGIKSDQPW
jgi:hypothetical protein|tara:strand:+ start:1348 stop:1887 length:540 start_codon:yes stop_codon:yes gene_type:complete